ncbi:MAG TPA: hypothetical protein VF260_05175 [Bacilli bacterium]
MEPDIAFARKPPEKSGLASAAFVLGILACSLNFLVITTPLGIVCGILALIFGAVTRKQARGFAGAVLSLFSFFIALVWVATYALINAKDPFL